MISIAIDGTAGTGKSTLAKKLSKELKYNYVNTGEMYRAIAYYFVSNKIDHTQDIVDLLNKINLMVTFENYEQRVFLNGVLLTDKELREEKIGQMAAVYSKIKEVREKTVQVQREIANNYNIIMEGRDIGSVVLPDANVKFFITASPEVRAQRRYQELLQKNKSANYEQIYKDLVERDNLDMTREISPLKVAENAFVIDTSLMNAEEVKEHCMKVIKSQIHH